MSGKTNKSVSKRFRVTPNGKLMFRRGPKNHYRAKKTGEQIRRIGGTHPLSETQAKTLMEQYLQNH
jgi:ribosomal protein L35